MSPQVVKGTCGHPRALTSTTIRPGWPELPWWTCAEAASRIGVSPRTVAKWGRKPVEDPAGGLRYRFRRMRTAARLIDAKSFLAYAESGVPQGERA